METTTITATKVIQDFIASIDEWDKEHSMWRYDEAIIADAARAIARIERMRFVRDNRSQ